LVFGDDVSSVKEWKVSEMNPDLGVLDLSTIRR
jgi:hypothetical protein